MSEINPEYCWAHDPGGWTCEVCRTEAQAKNLAGSFALIGSVLEVVENELELDMSIPHEIEITPGIAQLGDWWLNIDNEQYVQMEWFDGKIEIIMAGQYGDYLGV